MGHIVPCQRVGDLALGWKQYLLYFIVACMVPIGMVGGMNAAASGRGWFLAFGMVVVSPVAMSVLRYCYEFPFDLSGFFKPSVMSWGFVVGDTVVLPLALWFATRGHGNIPSASWGYDIRFAAASIVTGLAVVAGFRKIDGERYVQAGVPTALYSPTKVWHDIVVMSVVVTLFVWLLVPQIMGTWSDETAVAITMLTAFGALIVVDGLRPPDPAKQHPNWDTRRFHVAS